MLNKLIKKLTIGCVMATPLLLMSCSLNPGGKDGVYTAFGSDYNFYEHKPFLVVEVKNGKMTQALFDAVNRDGELITENRTLKSSMLKEIGTSPYGLSKELTADMLINQGTEKLLEASPHKDAAKMFKDLSDKLISESIEKNDSSILKIKTTEIK